MKIYTKKGDNGTTRLVDGSCVEKSNPRVGVYGTVDELNSFVGLLRSELALSKEHQQVRLQIDNLLSSVQHRLFDIGSLFATENKDILKKLKPIHEDEITPLEGSIDEMTATLEPLKNFILPTGHKLASLSHICRTICRRAEREGSLFKNDPDYSSSLIYLNRLSDYFFTLARHLNRSAQIEDVIWKN